VSDPVGAQGGDDLADLGDPVLAAFLADVDRHAEPGLARLLDERAQGAVGVGTVGVGAWAGDVDADDPARRVADRGRLVLHPGTGHRGAGPDTLVRGCAAL
jgi:hypothetical protein